MTRVAAPTKSKSKKIGNSNEWVSTDLREDKVRFRYSVGSAGSAGSADSVDGATGSVCAVVCCCFFVCFFSISPELKKVVQCTSASSRLDPLGSSQHSVPGQTLQLVQPGGLLHPQVGLAV